MLPKVKQIYTPYWSWECHKNGMYNSNNSQFDIDNCMSFISDVEGFGKSMLDVSKKWENTMLNHLTNPNINRVAFLGQCGVCYKIGMPDIVTRKCWKNLDINKQQKANRLAKQIIKQWILEQNFKTILKNGKQDVTGTEYQMKLKLF